MPPAGYSRPNTSTRLGDHEARIRALERVRADADIDYALLEGTATIPAGPSTSRFIFGLGGPGGDDPDSWTSNPDAFSLSSHNYSGSVVNGGLHQGVSFDLPGRYAMELAIQLISGDPRAGLDLQIFLEPTRDGVMATEMDFVFGDPSLIRNGFGFNKIIWAVYETDIPSGPIALQVVNSTGSTFGADVGLHVERHPHPPTI